MRIGIRYMRCFAYYTWWGTNWRCIHCIIVCFLETFGLFGTLRLFGTFGIFGIFGTFGTFSSSCTGGTGGTGGIGGIGGTGSSIGSTTRNGWQCLSSGATCFDIRCKTLHKNTSRLQLKCTETYEFFFTKNKFIHVYFIGLFQFTKKTK